MHKGDEVFIISFLMSVRDLRVTNSSCECDESPGLASEDKTKYSDWRYDFTGHCSLFSVMSPIQ